MRDYRNIFNKVVPYHTDNSMSLYEFVGRLYEYIKNFEGTLDEAHEKIDEFITQFSTDLNDTTKGILTEWHNDGTLADLVNLVWSEKADKVYVDNLVNQTASDLTNNYTQADNSLRDWVNASVGSVESDLDTKITDNTQEIARVTNWVNNNTSFISLLHREIKSEYNVNMQNTNDFTRLFIQPMYSGLNTPTDDLGVLIHIPYSPDWAYQIWIDIQGNRKFSRYYNNTVWTTWRRVGQTATTKSTRAMAANTNYSEDKQISVVQKNGWVTVDFRIRCVDPSVSMITLYTGLPKPANGQYKTVASIGASKASLGVELLVTGELMVRYGESATSYIGSFTYAIDE